MTILMISWQKSQFEPHEHKIEIYVFHLPLSEIKLRTSFPNHILMLAFGKIV